jgi:hypothetical protein
MVEAKTLQASARAWVLPPIALTDGAVESLKWLALVLMTVDHINKYLLHERVPAMFAIGRLALTIFAFVLAFNLARPGTLARGVYGRLIKRLAIVGAVASAPFIALGGLAWGWWPLNVLAMLLVAVAVMYLVDLGGRARVALAVLVFLVGGAIVEFWWLGVATCLGAWRYCKRPSWPALFVWIGSTAALYVINQNLWALAAIPVIFAATGLRVSVPRLQRAFYGYYPAHLCVLWAAREWLQLGGTA